MKIAFLHTAAIHQQTFDALLSNAQVEVTHHIQPDWLDRAQKEGLFATLRSEVLAGLARLAKQADAVVCTCTTLGPLVDELNLKHVFRIDYPMMQVAAASQGRVLLAICLESTVQPSSELLEQAYAIEGAAPQYEVLRCDNAWAHFEQGQPALFDQSIAESVIQAITEAEQGQDVYACVVLAQASMAGAAQHIQAHISRSIKVLRSPPLAVMHALLLAAEPPGEGIIRQP